MVILLRLTHLWCPTILREITPRINVVPPTTPFFFSSCQHHPPPERPVGLVPLNHVSQIGVNETFGGNVDTFDLTFLEK